MATSCTQASLSLARTRQISLITEGWKCCSSCVEDVWASGGTILCGCSSRSAPSFCPSVCRQLFVLSTLTDRLHLRPLWTAKNAIVFFCLLVFFPLISPVFPGHAFSRAPVKINWPFVHLVSCFQTWFCTKQNTKKCVSKQTIHRFFRNTAFLCRRHFTAFCAITDRRK